MLGLIGMICWRLSELSEGVVFFFCVGDKK